MIRVACCLGLLLVGRAAAAQPASDSFSYVFGETLREPNRTVHLLPEDFHVFSGRRYELPSIPLSRNESFLENARMLDTVAQESPDKALDLFFSGVSGGLYSGYERKSQPGAPARPAWDYWGYATVRGEGDPDMAAAAGNFNYAVAGKIVFGRALERLGVEGPIADKAIETVLRFGAGFAETFDEDTRFRNLWSRDYNWYFDDPRAARPLEDGFKYADYVRLELKANVVGVHLDPESFGVIVPKAQPIRSYLFDQPIRLDEPDYSVFIGVP